MLSYPGLPPAYQGTPPSYTSFPPTMPQVFFALQCFQCETFQVAQKTQQQKFACKLCGAKQSIVRVYATGAAKDVRPVVQQLNMARAHADPYEAASHTPAPPQPARWDQYPQYFQHEQQQHHHHHHQQQQHQQHQHQQQYAPALPPQQGRWDQYLAPPPPQYEEEEEGGYDDPRFITSVDDRQRGKRKRQGGAADAAGAARQREGRGPPQREDLQRESLQRENLGANAMMRSHGSEAEGCDGFAAARGGHRGHPMVAAPGHAAGGRGGSGLLQGGAQQPAAQSLSRHAAPALAPARAPPPRRDARDAAAAEDGFFTGGLDLAVEEETWD